MNKFRGAKRRGNLLIIFIKNPDPGKVKTRLAKDIGEEKAVFLYRLFVEMILKKTDHDSFKRIVFFDPPERHREISNWLGNSLDFYAQKGRDLGERLSGAFDLIFSKGAKKVIVIGSDSPLIDAGLISDAFGRLDYNDCVIGPSQDGGYYLLGLKFLYRYIFEDIEWSTNKVFGQTMARLNKLNLRYSILKKHFDVDNMKDLDLLRQELLKIS